MARRQPAARKVPFAHDWRTTDEDEVERRRIRAHTERFTIRNLDPRHPIFSNFRIGSGSGLDYSVEVRDLRERQFACSCVDFRINGLGTCKHVEAVLLHLEARYKKPFQTARENGSGRIDIVPDGAAGTLRVIGDLKELPKPLRDLFDADGLLRDGAAEESLERLTHAAHPRLRISQEVEPWILAQRRASERRALRKDYEHRVQAGSWPAQETTVPLFPYQREGMLHLAFNERALLADEMGLGKTIQAIAACALLYRLGQAERVLIVTPASLKTEWEEQIRRFTPVVYQIVFGGPKARLSAYGHAPFFTIVNYEQMVKDALTVNAELEPDIVVLDEAQRIKNWSTQTAQAIKRLQSRYAFVLTGTPIENRIDDIHSLIIFSEWERMLLLGRGLCQERGLGCAWHTGSVPQLRRRGEINLFKTDPECRLFLTTDAGSTGLNLQNASVVINCDLPWNPARLEQRIARAWRKHQTRPVTVIHLVSEGTIEHRMLGTLANKQALAEGVLDLKGDLDAIAFGGGKQAFLERLHQLVGTRAPGVPPPAAPVPTDRAQTFALRAQERLGAALVRCEEEYPLEGEHSVVLVVVERDAERWRPELEALHREIAGPGKGDPLAPLHLEVMDRHMAKDPRAPRAGRPPPAHHARQPSLAR